MVRSLNERTMSTFLIDTFQEGQIMKKLAYLSLALVLAVVPGCQTVKSVFSGSPDAVTRILADIGCVTAAAAAGVQIIGDPSVNGAKTASGVLAAIMAIGTSNIPAAVLSACKDTLGFAAQDATAAATLVAATTGTDQPKASMPKMAGKPPEQPKAPQPVIIPLPRK